MFFLNGEAGWHSRIPREGVDIRELVDDEDDVVEDEDTADKLANPDHYDKVVYAEIPDPNKQPELHQLFQETTQQGDDSYPLYRQRDNGIEKNVQNNGLDNRWVVPYNPKLLMMFNYHINVEIKIFQDARYVSPPEAMWRIYGFPLSNVYPSVMSLQVHLPNKQFVTLEEDVVLTNILERERNKRSMLTAFFELNQTDTQARQHLYKDIPQFYTWNKRERFYLRVLLQHVKGPTSFDYLYTINDVLYTTFRRVDLERGLIKSDDYIHASLRESSTHKLPDPLIRLFTTLLILCDVEDVRKSLSDFDLPNITADVRLYVFRFREVHEELSIVVKVDDILARHSLNSDQKNAYDAIMRHVDADSSGVFFIDGPGGTGKTFLYKALLATFHSRGLIALATASSGAAANNMTGGRTAHPRFKIPINVTTNLICNIKKQSG
ncbi:helicase-like protein [Tanacetum coccineum]